MDESEEIEITPEMIEAGAAEFLNWRDLEYGTANTAAYAIFRVMVYHAPKPYSRKAASS